MIAPKATTTTAPGSHQRDPKRRMPNTSTAPPSAANPAPIACDLATSAAQPVQSWVTRPTSLARSRAAADSGSAAAPVASEIAAATAAPASTGRLSAAIRSGGRRTNSASTPEADHGLAGVDPQLAGPEALRPLDLGRAEVGSRLDPDRLGPAIAGTHQDHGALRDEHRGDERYRQAP